MPWRRGIGFSSRFGTAAQRTASRGEQTADIVCSFETVVQILISSGFVTSCCDGAVGGDKPGPGAYTDAKLSPRVARSESS